MTKRLIDRLSRRQFLGGTVMAAAGVAMVSRANAQALEKAAVNYQDGPNGDQQCDNCVFWVPGDTPDAVGGCSMVQGEISPVAWCAIWAPQA